MEFFIKIIGTFLAGIMCLFFYARYLEHKSLYYPVLEIEHTPKDLGIEYDDILFNTKDNVRLNGWLVRAPNSKGTILFAHGNGGNIGHCLDKIAFFNKLGFNVFTFDYRGYGKSQGSSSEKGLYLDIKAAYKFINDKNLGVPIVVYGESLGGAIAIDLAARNDITIAGLIVEGTFTSIEDMAKTIYPMLPGFLLKTKFDSIGKISKIKVPKLHFHAQDDNIVPFTLGRELFKAADNPKKFIILEGVHNDCFFISEDLVKSSLVEFINSIVSD